MKKVVAIILSCALVMSACTVKRNDDTSETSELQSLESQEIVADRSGESDVAVANEITETTSQVINNLNNDITFINDSSLPGYLEDEIYQDLIDVMGEDYVIQNIGTTYVSREFLEEIAYNSRENLYYGYSLSDLDAQFDGTRYMFTCNDEGNTEVVEYKIIEEASHSYTDIFRNIAIGGGVILVCVTVAAIAYPAAPAVSAVLAVGAQAGVSWGVGGGLISGAVSGIATGIQTGDFDEALYAFAEAGSQGFMIGAISGCLAGGISEFAGLKAATSGGLSMNEVARIQLETHYPLELISRFQSYNQYEIIRDTGLRTEMINNHTALVRDIDLNYVGIDPTHNPDGLTNLQRMQQGLAPYDSTNVRYELHHLGQQNDSPLVILTHAEHMEGGNNTIWHTLGLESENPSSDPAWNSIREAFWKNFASKLI